MTNGVNALAAGAVVASFMSYRLLSTSSTYTAWIAVFGVFALAGLHYRMHRSGARWRLSKSLLMLDGLLVLAILAEEAFVPIEHKESESFQSFLFLAGVLLAAVTVCVVAAETVDWYLNRRKANRRQSEQL